ncbi:14085_t:CDS:2, partial [Gigaspora margarita]
EKIMSKSMEKNRLEILPKNQLVKNLSLANISNFNPLCKNGCLVVYSNNILCLGKIIAMYEKCGQQHAWVEKPVDFLDSLSYISIKVYIQVANHIFSYENLAGENIVIHITSHEAPSPAAPPAASGAAKAPSTGAPKAISAAPKATTAAPKATTAAPKATTAAPKAITGSPKAITSAPKASPTATSQPTKSTDKTVLSPNPTTIQPSEQSSNLGILGIIACASVVCHIFLHISGGPSSAVWQIGASVDIILRSIVIIIVGTPPPERLIQKLRIKLFERAIVNVTLRERGVVSTGIIMDEFCGWKMDQQIN